MERYEITGEMNLKKIIAESREVAQALNEFADNLERIEKKYAEPRESVDEESSEIDFIQPKKIVGKLISEDNG